MIIIISARKLLIGIGRRVFLRTFDRPVRVFRVVCRDCEQRRLLRRTGTTRDWTPGSSRVLPFARPCQLFSFPVPNSSDTSDNIRPQTGHTDRVRSPTLGFLSTLRNTGRAFSPHDLARKTFRSFADATINRTLPRVVRKRVASGKGYRNAAGAISRHTRE